jgi:hypothetical protein
MKYKKMSGKKSSNKKMSDKKSSNTNLCSMDSLASDTKEMTTSKTVGFLDLPGGESAIPLFRIPTDIYNRDS